MFDDDIWIGIWSDDVFNVEFDEEFT